MRPGFLVAALVVGALSASGGSAGQSSPGQPQTGTIGGRVVLAENRRPAADAVVTVTDGQNTVARTTDDNGTFTFPNLKPGQYYLAATKERYLTVKYGQVRPGSAGLAVPIRLAAGDRLDRFELALPLAGVIAGLVTSTNGEPLQNASITAWRFTWRTGERTLTEAEATLTDDRGEYRLTSLIPGDYVIGARPPRRATDGSPAVIFYPLAVSPSQAAPVTLATGELKSGVDFRLPRIALAGVRGVVLRADGTAAENIPVEATELGGVMTGQPSGSYSHASGRFELIGFPPGRFRLVTMSEFGLWATTEVVVGSRDVEDVELRLQPMGTLSGRMVMDDRDNTPVPGTLVVWQPADIRGPSRFPVASNRSGTDGRFTITSVREGIATLSFPTGPDGLTVKSVVVNGRDVFDVPFDLGASQSAENVVVTWTRRKSSLVGTLVDPQQRPTADYLVLVYSTDERHWRGSRHLMTTRPATDGRYGFGDLPPGSYRLAVLNDAEEGQWFDPAFLRALTAASVAVTIREGAETVQNLQTRIPLASTPFTAIAK